LISIIAHDSIGAIGDRWPDTLATHRASDRHIQKSDCPPTHKATTAIWHPADHDGGAPTTSAGRFSPLGPLGIVSPSVPAKHLLIKNDAFGQHLNGLFSRHSSR
jgi:hypothetical protein